MSKIKYREVLDTDTVWLKRFIADNWGSDYIVVHSEIFYPIKLKGYIAELDDIKAGVITFQIKQDICEIITINSIIKNRGIGTDLVELVKFEAKKAKCKKIILTTTNDNLTALSFYKKLGFRVQNVYMNAVKNSRKLKPEIPLYGENGIQIKDEIELVLMLENN